jgi:hypothetical protein
MMAHYTKRGQDTNFDGMPPNELPVSRRERAATRFQKKNDLAREAVGCTGVLGRER